tara:strand:+ start:263 stop:682 length:420 start_codon:yes stop_codon:yes gene_type:complete
MAIRWLDLLGSPYKLHGDGEEGFDCSSLAEAIVRRTGRQVPQTSPFRVITSANPASDIQSYFDAMENAYDKVGIKIHKANQVGDLVLCADNKGVPRGLYVLVEPNRGTFLTAHERAGVVSVRRFTIKNIVGIYRARCAE